MESWKLAMSTELFFQEAEKRIECLEDGRKNVLQDRLKNARAMLGSLDPIDFMEEWQAPHDLYETKYGDE